MDRTKALENGVKGGMVIEPIFERDFAEHSYGFRPGRGCKEALRRVEQLLQAGPTWVVDADLFSLQAAWRSAKSLQH